jgi:hypothetical protein
MFRLVQPMGVAFPMASGGGGAAAAAFAPSDIAGLQLWCKADALVLNNDDPVTTWTDSSGAGHDLSQSSAGAKPTYKTNIVNGKPVIRFDGSSDVMAVTYTQLQPVTAFVIAACDTFAGDNRTLFDGQTINTMIFRIDSATGVTTLYAGAVLQHTAIVEDTWTILTAVVNGASSKIFVSGGTPASGDAGAQTFTGLTVGRDGTSTAFWAGDIAEIILYDTSLSNANLNNVGTYLATKYALTWNTVS